MVYWTVTFLDIVVMQMVYKGRKCTPAMVVDDGEEILDIFILRNSTHFHESLQKRFRHYTPSFQYETIYLFILLWDMALKRHRPWGIRSSENGRNEFCKLIWKQIF